MFTTPVRGLRIQLLLWTVLPLTLVLIIVALIGITVHERSMRTLVEELNARSARLAATHLRDSLTDRVTLLSALAANQVLASDAAFLQSFDGGVAIFDTTDVLRTAYLTSEMWDDLAVRDLRTKLRSVTESSFEQSFYASFFTNSATTQPYLLIAVLEQDETLLVGAVSPAQLGLTNIAHHLNLARQADLEMATNEIDSDDDHHPDTGGAVVFLVDADGTIIYHPDSTRIGQNLANHAGVQAVVQGFSGATYHQEASGEELVVGYAPVSGQSWGLIVQEPWTAFIAPTMRLSLLAPLVVIVAALVSGLAVTFGLRYIVRPLQALDRQATAVAWGDFSATSDPVDGIQEIEDLRRTLAGMADQIQRYQTGMRDYIAAVTLAQEEERKRLARELHDETVQSLIAVGQRLEMIQKALDTDPERARQRLAELQIMAKNLQDEVRRFSRALRPLYLEDLGFVPALEMLAQEIEREQGLTVSVQTEGAVIRLAPDLELTAYRIAQEGLSNVVRHAEATTVFLQIIFVAADHSGGPNGLRLCIRDDGHGFEAPLNPSDLAHQGHYGLMGIHERALLFGGQMTIQSNPGSGTTLELFLPFTTNPTSNVPA